MECFLSEFTICMVKTANNRPKIRKMSQIKVKSKKSKKYRQVRARNEISVQYYSFFQEVGTLLQSFRLEELPEQVYSTHRIKLISDESSWQFKKLLGETLSYVQLVSSSHNGLQCYYNVLIGRFFLTVKVLNLHINSEIETYDN